MEAKKLELIKQQILRQREAVRGAKMENDIKAGLLVEVSEVVRDIVVLVSDLRAHFRRIEDGLPLALAGLSIAEQRMVIRKHFDDMSATIEKSDFSKRAEQK